MQEIAEEVVRGTATICGPHSGAARAIVDAEKRRAAGERVTFFRERGAIYVVGSPIGAKEQDK